MKYGLVVSAAAAMAPELSHLYCRYPRLKTLIIDMDDPSKREAANMEFWSTLREDRETVFKHLAERHAEMPGLVSDVDEALSEVESDPLLLVNNYDELYNKIAALDADVSFVRSYNETNVTAFSKIVKKHRKRTAPLGIRQDDADVFENEVAESPYRDCTPWDEFQVRVRGMRSQTAALRRVSDQAVLADKSINQTFLRKTRKYFVRVSELPTVMAALEEHLSEVRFDGSERNPRTSSIYFDTANLEMYHRRLMRYDGATLIRMRWYSAWGKSRVFVEKKTHHEGDRPSLKERVGVSHKIMNTFMTGNKNKVKKAIGKGALNEPLAREILPHVLSKDRLRPTLRVSYNRVAYQKAADDLSVRVSVDTNIEMATVLPQRSALHKMKSIRTHDFPCGIVEIKLQTAAPQWLIDLQRDKVLVSASKFSKYCHGVSTLSMNRLEYLSIDEPRYLARKMATPAAARPMNGDDHEDSESDVSVSRAPHRPLHNMMLDVLGGGGDTTDEEAERVFGRKAGPDSPRSQSSGAATSSLDDPRSGDSDEENDHVFDEDVPGMAPPRFGVSKSFEEAFRRKQAKKALRKTGRRGSDLGAKVMARQEAKWEKAAAKQAKKEARMRIYGAEWRRLDWIDVQLPTSSGMVTKESRRMRKALDLDREESPMVLDMMYPLEADLVPGISRLNLGAKSTPLFSGAAPAAGADSWTPDEDAATEQRPGDASLSAAAAAVLDHGTGVGA